MATDEDRRAAVAIEASLSSYLMTAVLAIIGAQAVIIGLVLDKKEHLERLTKPRYASNQSVPLPMQRRA